MRRQCSTSRGAALLIAIAALVILTAGCVALASVAARTKISRDVDHLVLIAEDLLIAAEAPILDWLRRASRHIVLPPESPSPEVPVLHEIIEHEGIALELRITGWDQTGMVPLQLARGGSPLRMALPEHVLSQLEELPRDQASAAAGLDSFARPLDENSISPFPKPIRSETQITQGSVIRTQRSALPQREEQEPLALGSMLATHGGRINVNTAPLPVLEQAMRAAGRGGIEIVMANRAAGRSTSVGSLGTRSRSESSSPDLVASSDAWAFRIDVQVSHASGTNRPGLRVQRSWWAIYQRASGREARLHGGWQCVQRMVVHD